ncbi:hypothetical protein J2X61_006348 [Bacillus sp. 3255]|nr:hypothetical protein [Bacillus sp. 3255]
MRIGLSRPNGLRFLRGVRILPHSVSLQWLASIAEPVGSMQIGPRSGIGMKIELAP